MTRDFVLSVIVWLLYTAMSFAGLVLKFFAVTRRHRLLLKSADPL